MFMFFLKRVLPFTLTLLLGAILGTLAGRAFRAAKDIATLTAGDAEVREYKIHRQGRACGGGGGGRGSGIGPSYGSASNDIYAAREVERQAVLLSKPEPGFTEAARQNNTSGVVTLRMALTSTGQVSNVSVIRGLPDGLTERAMEAAMGVKFEPALKDGRPVSQWITLEYNFNIY
jgi:TonB family protein